MNSLGASFSRLWSASLITNLADGVIITAAPLLAVSLTNDPVLIAALSACITLPWLLLAIPIGVVVDKFDRRHLIATANGLRFLVAASIALAIATHTITIYWLFLTTFIIGTCEVLADTSAQALIPSILDPTQYEKGNSRLQISETVVQGFIGTPISGFLYAAAIYLPFIANSTGFFIAALLTLSIPPVVAANLKEKSSETFRSQMKFGISYLIKDKNLLRIVLTTGSVGFWFSVATSTNVLFVLKELHLSKSLFGVMLAVQSIGAISGGLLAPKLSAKFGRGKVMATAIVANSIIMILSGITPNIMIFTVITTVASFSISNWNVLLMASYQDRIPADVYGRIHGARRTFVWGVTPIGSLLGGFIAHAGLRIPIVVGGIFSTIISLASVNFILRFAHLKEYV
jgi:MFS family permease